MTAGLTRRARSLVRWSVGGAVLGLVIGLAILAIDARWYAVSPEPGVVLSRQASVPGLVVDGCEDATFQARLPPSAPQQDRLVSFEGCLSDHAIVETVEIRRRDGPRLGRSRARGVRPVEWRCSPWCSPLWVPWSPLR